MQWFNETCRPNGSGAFFRGCDILVWTWLLVLKFVLCYCCKVYIPQTHTHTAPWLSYTYCFWLFDHIPLPTAVWITCSSVSSRSYMLHSSVVSFIVVCNISQLTIFTNPTMHMFHIPQCTIQNRYVYISVRNRSHHLKTVCPYCYDIPSASLYISVNTNSFSQTSHIGCILLGIFALYFRNQFYKHCHLRNLHDFCTRMPSHICTGRVNICDDSDMISAYFAFWTNTRF